MNITPANGMATYAENLKGFEIECLLDKREFFVNKQIRLIQIIYTQLKINKNIMHSILKFNGLSCYLKSEALAMSGNFWNDAYSKIRDIYKISCNEEMDDSLSEKILRMKGKNIVLPESEEISYKIYKSIVMGPGKELLNHFLAINNIQMLNYNSIIPGKEAKNLINKLECRQYVTLKNKLINKTIVEIAGKENFEVLMLGNAVSQFMKQNFHIVTGKRQFGDTILYINPKNEIWHIGLFINSTTVESKWGQLPVFLHKPEDCPYESSYIVMRES